MDTVLEKVFPYEGIPEIALNFFSPEEKHYKGSLVLQKELEKKYKITNSETYFNNKLHSYNDVCAVSRHNIQAWMLYGKLHRDYDRPAIVGLNDREEWWFNGKRHREGDKPALIYKTNVQKVTEWWINGERHRDGDKPAIVYTDGQQEWWLNGKRHREGENPAVVYTNGYQWWVDGRLLYHQQIFDYSKWKPIWPERT